MNLANVYAYVLPSCHRPLKRAAPLLLQAALEAALLAGDDSGGGGAVGARGWRVVRQAYAVLGLSPGRSLAVALLTYD